MKPKPITLVLILLPLILSTPLFSQVVPIYEKYANDTIIPPVRQIVRIMFYNVENLYDPSNDSLTLDDEFTPGGLNHWSNSRFYKKLFYLAKTIIAAGDEEPPAIVGMCEIENLRVLQKLTGQSPLKRFGYRIVHHDSPDLRGVDVALIYRPEIFTLLSWKTFRIRFPFDSTLQTREILLVKGLIFQHDTINLLVNHWPSRRGGYAESQPKRNHVASVLKKISDSLQKSNPWTSIIIMGDLNDEPGDESIASYLEAKTPWQKIQEQDLVNLMEWHKKAGKGTIKYKEIWSVFDQFIISGNLFKGTNGIKATQDDARIFNAPFLTQPDLVNLDVKLKRTYAGPRYIGGFSDHLPVTIDLRRFQLKVYPSKQ